MGDKQVMKLGGGGLIAIIKLSNFNRDTALMPPFYLFCSRIFILAMSSSVKFACLMALLTVELGVIRKMLMNSFFIAGSTVIMANNSKRRIGKDVGCNEDNVNRSNILLDLIHLLC